MFLQRVLSLSIFILSLGLAGAEDKPLPRPQTHGGKPLMDALRERQSIREFSPRAIPDQLLSDLLWAACGINRPGNGHRTVPSAMNSQEVDVYVTCAEGSFRYEPKAHALHRVSVGDLRAQTGGQPFVTHAPVALVFVADLSRLAKARPEERPMYAGIDTGYVSQNVYLFCASAGLATVVHELGNRRGLAQGLGLGSDHRIILAQAVGYPATNSATPNK